MMKRKLYQITALTIAMVLTTGSFWQIPVQAAGTSGSKEEVIYVKLNAGGQLKNAYAVNIFNEKNVVDFGDYSEVKNLTTEDEIMMRDGMIKIAGSSDKIYYQGLLKDPEIPWNFHISYEIDGKEYAPAEAAGQSGKLRMTLAVSENKKAKPGFFDAYALQITLKLNGENCRNIVCEGATIANAGKMKQLSLTVLPGKEKEFVITGDVTDFEMESIAINGINLDLGLDTDSFDKEELYEKTDEIKDAAVDFDEGADELNDGAVKLGDGAGELSDGVEMLQDGVIELSDGITEYTDGVTSLKDGIASLQEGSQTLSDGAGSLADGAGSLLSGAGELKDKSAQLAGGIQQLNQQVQNLTISGVSLTDEQISIIKDTAASGSEIASAADALAAGISSSVAGEVGNTIRSESTVSSISGMLQSSGMDESTADGVAAAICGAIAGQIGSDDINSSTLQYACLSALQSAAGAGAAGGAQAVEAQVNAGLSSQGAGFGELQSAVAQINDGASALSQGAATLYNGVKELKGGADTLYNGIDELKEGSNGLQEGSQTLSDNSAKLLDGTSQLQDGVVELRDGTVELKDGTEELKDGVRKLKDGTREFTDKTDTINDTIDEELENAIAEMTGGDFAMVSFVSDKNSKVDSVQFVISTDGIEMDTENTVTEAVSEKLTLWQKFLNLFRKKEN